MQNRRPWTAVADGACLAVLFAWLIWLPLPFGSITERARTPLIAVPFALCAAAAVVRYFAIRLRPSTLVYNDAYRIWTAGAAALAVVVAIQLLPLPAALLAAISPQSQQLWSEAARVASLATGREVGAAANTISVDPDATWRELFRLLGLFATFHASAILVRNKQRRSALAVVLAAAVLFEMLYGVREAALRRYEIWGWTNTLIFNRVTGTFVNPNHFAHYVAIILPMALFLMAVAWHEAGPNTPVLRRLVRVAEHRLVSFGLAALAALGCLAAILVAQSRGGVLAAFGGLSIIGAVMLWRQEKRTAPRRIVMAAGGGLLLLVALVAFLGPQRTVARFKPLQSERATLVGRTIGIKAAVGVWRMFPILGSGFGTFGAVVSMTQSQDMSKIYDHVHNDYAELGATTGIVGFLIGVGALLAGYVVLARSAFSTSQTESWRRRAFQLAALTSLTVAMVHALFDFNFYIPANAATLAAILGAAVGVRER